MKMPTAIVAGHSRVVEWKPGHSMSLPFGDGTFSPSSHQDNRLPLVTRTMDSSSIPTLLPRALLKSREKRNTEESGSSSLPSSLRSSSFSSAMGNGEEKRKRFPILGPTRQETELYFRTRRSGRRSAKDRVKAESRPLVTRSADRIILPESTPTPRLILTTNLTPTTITSASFLRSGGPTSTATTTVTNVASNKTTTSRYSNARKSVDHVEQDLQDSLSSMEINKNTLPSSERGTMCPNTSPVFPGFDPSTSFNSMTTSSPAVERLENSPEQVGTALPLPAFEPLQASFREPQAVRGGGKKKPERSPGQARATEQSQKMLKLQREQRQKTLQPSKHGFHPRSNSPTFKRLVDAFEKLHDVAIDSVDYRHVDRCHLCHHAGRTSPVGVVLPAVAGVWDGEEAGEVDDESDSEVNYLHTHPFLSSLPHSSYRSKYIFGVNSKNKLTRTIGTTMCSNPKLHDAFNRKGCEAPPADPVNDWGAWEVDSVSVESGVDPGRMTVSLGLPSSDTPTELHLFLPRLGDAASDDGSTKVSVDRSCSRPVENQTPNPPQRGKGMPHFSYSHRMPQRSQSLTQQQPPWTVGEERNGRPQEKRFNSPVRATKRDRTPTNERRVTAPPIEIYEAYEPYVKGERLKKKLEDFPTLISLDQD